MRAQSHVTESLGQALAWDEVKAQYLRLGLCHRCAAQAAYGHSFGFSNIERPCRRCETVVRMFDLPAWGEWRRASQRARRSGLLPPWQGRGSGGPHPAHGGMRPGE